MCCRMGKNSRNKETRRDYERNSFITKKVESALQCDLG